MANLNHGYKYGERIPVRVPLDASTTAIDYGDMLTVGTAGYYQKAVAGDIPYGVAMEDVETSEIPSADGGRYITMDVSRQSVYRYAVGAGTVTAAMRGKTCDTFLAQSIDVTASTDDQVLIVEVDTVNNEALVQLLIPSLGGVV